MSSWSYFRLPIVTCGVLILLARAFVSAQADGREVVTLRQAVAHALEHNTRMVDDRDSVEQASLGVRLARDAFDLKVVPNIMGSFGQTNVSNQSYRLDVLRRFSAGTELRASAGAATSQIPSAIEGQGDISFYNADTTLSLNQPLLRGFGSTVNRRSQATAELNLLDTQRRVARNQQLLAVEVATAYYGVVAQQALLLVSQQSLDRSRKLLAASEAKLEAGMVSQLDALRARQLVSSAELQLYGSESAMQDAFDQLRTAMGRDSDAPFDVVKDIPETTDTLTAEAAVELALQMRSDLQSAIDYVADGERAVAYSRNQLLPQLDANLALTRRETSPSFTGSFGLNRFEVATFFNISMPVDRTPQLIAYQNALIERDRRQRSIQTLRRTISDDVKKAVRSRDRLQRELAAAAVAVDLAKKEVEVAQERYERGLSNNLDVVSAEGSLLSMESRHIAAQAELAVAGLRLRAIVGVLDPRRDIADVQVR